MRDKSVINRVKRTVRKYHIFSTEAETNKMYGNKYYTWKQYKVKMTAEKEKRFKKIYKEIELEMKMVRQHLKNRLPI